MARITKYIPAVSTGAVHQKQGVADKNNCVVRCLANCTDMQYDQAHKMFADAGRRVNKGMFFQDFYPVYKQYAKDFRVVGTGRNAGYFTRCYSKVNDSCPMIEEGVTLSKFIERNPVGVFGVIVRGHILTVRNGKIYDIADNNGNKRVCGYFVF